MAKKDQFCDGDVALGSNSSSRKRRRPSRKIGSDQLKPECHLNITKESTKEDHLVCDGDGVLGSTSFKRKRSPAASSSRGDQLKLESSHSATKGLTRKELVCHGDVASGSRLSERKRSRRTRKLGGGQLKEEVCPKCTNGKCNERVKCGYSHSFDVHSRSNSQECQKQQDDADSKSIIVLNQNSVKLDVDLGSQPFKGQGSSSRASFKPENNVSSDSIMAASQSYNAILSKERDVEHPTNALQSNHADGKTEQLVTSYTTVDMSETSTIKTPSRKRKRVKRRSSSSKHDVGSMTTHLTDASQQLPVSSEAVTSLDHVSVGSATDFVGTIFGLSHEVNEKSEGTSQSPNNATVVLEKDEITGNTIDSNHAIDQKLETKNMVKTLPKKRSRKKRLTPSKVVMESISKEINDASSPGMLISSKGGKSLDLEVNEKSEGTSQLPNNASLILEKDEITGDTIDSNHGIDQKLETKNLLKTLPKKKSRKKRHKPSKVVMESISIEINDTSSPGMLIGSKGGKSLDHEVNEKSEGTSQLPNNATVELEKDEITGDTIGSNHAIDQKLETKNMVKTLSKRKSRKRRLKSSKVVMESISKEITGTSSPGMLISSKGGETLDHESVASKEDKIAGVNIDVDHEVNDKQANLEAKTCPEKGRRNDSYDEQRDKDLIVKVQNNVEPLPSIPQEGLLLANADNSSLQISRPLDNAILKSRRKLLVLDVNGLLVDIVADFPKRINPDFKLSGKGVFKRPFCDDFLKFCFEKFDVGIWSSRTKKNLTRVVDFLLTNSKEILVFCWDNSHCTDTGYKTVENYNKPLVLKELKKIWEKKWQTGFYNESNTILLDDSPYKALRNPPNTAIFPFPYSFQDIEDKSLGPDGDLRLYLERLANAENVQSFIQANPFGQRSITRDDPSWTFYSKISGDNVNQQVYRPQRPVSHQRPVGHQPPDGHPVPFNHQPPAGHQVPFGHQPPAGHQVPFGHQPPAGHQVPFGHQPPAGHQVPFGHQLPFGHPRPHFGHQLSFVHPHPPFGHQHHPCSHQLPFGHHHPVGHPHPFGHQHPIRHQNPFRHQPVGHQDPYF